MKTNVVDASDDAVRSSAVWNSIGLRLLVVLVVLLSSGCVKPADATVDANVKLEIDPDPPQVGKANVVVTLTDASGAPLDGRSLEVEGNMNHAGMKPVFSTFEQTKPGRFEGSLEFTMAGDWFLLLNGTLSDGRNVSEKVDVPGVERR